MQYKKFYILAVVTLFVLSGFAILMQNQNTSHSAPQNIPVSNYQASTNTYLGGNVSLPNVSINSSNCNLPSLHIISGHLVRSLYANNLNISSAGVLYTDGHNIYLAGTFDNKGHVYTGQNYNLMVEQFSYGGSGGGARGNNSTLDSNGYSTIAPGGLGSSGIHAQNGSSVKIPVINNGIIQGMYSSGFSQYLTGAAGQYYSYYNSTTGYSYFTSSGDGGYGIYIQANKIIAGKISSQGENGLNSTTYNAYTGGGGGGAIILSYSGSNLTSGNISTLGGNGGKTNTSNYSGGNGGKGNVYNYSYGKTPPISVGTVFHLPIIKPVFVFNNSTTSFSLSTFLPGNVTVPGNGTYKITSVNTGKYTFNLSQRVYYQGKFDFYNSYANTYNDSKNTVNYQYGLIYGPRTMDLLNSGILSATFTGLTFLFSNQIMTIQTGVPISTPMGYVLTDKVSIYNPSLGASLSTLYIDQNSGLVVKIVSIYIDLQVSNTNVPLDHTSAPFLLPDNTILEVAAAAILIVGVSGYVLMHRRKK